MSIFQPLRLPQVPGDTTRFDDIFLFADRYLILSKNWGRNVYLTTVENYLKHCLGNKDDPQEQTCWRALDDSAFGLGDELVKASAAHNCLYINQLDLKAFRNLFAAPTGEDSDDFRTQYVLEWKDNRFLRRRIYNGLGGALEFGDHYASIVENNLYVDLYIDYDRENINVILENYNRPRNQRNLEIYPFSIDTLFSGELLYGPENVDFDFTESRFKIRYIQDRQAVVILLTMQNHITQGIYHDLSNRQSELRRFMDVNSEFGVLVDGRIINLHNNIETFYSEVQNTIPGRWWIPLGFTTQNRTYWLQFRYTPEYIQPTQVMLLPEGRVWSIPSVVTKIMIPEELRQEFVNYLELKSSNPIQTYDLIFHTLFGENFWNWNTDDHLERLILWSKKSIIYLHPQSAQVWINPVFSNYSDVDIKLSPLSIHQPVEANDQGLILVPNAVSGIEYKLFHASLIQINNLAIVEERTRNSILANQIKLEKLNLSGASLPSEIQENILRQVLN